MATDLNPENERYLRELVVAGAYPDESTALNEAVRLFRRRSELVAAVRAGTDQADRGELVPAEEVWERLERQAAEFDDGTGRK